MKQLFFFTFLVASSACTLFTKAQSVDLQAVSIGPTPNTPIAINQQQTVQVVIKNNGPDAIPVNEARLTISINLSTLRYDSPTGFTDPRGIWTVTSTSGNTLQVTNTGGAVPGDPNTGFILSFSIRGHAAGSGDLTVASSLLPTSTVSDRDGTNQSASGSSTVTSALPVALVSFTATPQENRTIRLDWTTSLETNNKGFRVERSHELTRFEKVADITEVAPASNTLKAYTLVDQMPYSGTSYYRLTQLDLDGRTTTYPVVSVMLRGEAYGVFPNPVMKDGRFTLRLDEPETATINVFSANGRVLPVQKTGVQSGNLLLKTTDSPAAGLYVLTVQERGQTRHYRLVVE